ncbi:hypothetical protein PR048_020990 [Dryococelus australis]|uniref:Uncharacterized protein n=1 Tax=Dryococelus australis TaxID=614101 RepID=A0ABQ9GWZ2_9NEOP|nr:hypothetical protein PR048_020990 [Dryococelus australis]
MHMQELPGHHLLGATWHMKVLGQGSSDPERQQFVIAKCGEELTEAVCAVECAVTEDGKEGEVKSASLHRSVRGDKSRVRLPSRRLVGPVTSRAHLIARGHGPPTCSPKHAQPDKEFRAFIYGKLRVLHLTRATTAYLLAAAVAALT